MNSKQIKKINDTLRNLKVNEDDTSYFVTLTFPDPSMDLKDAEKIIKKHLDVLRKEFPDAYFMSVMAFDNRYDSNGIHYHNIIVHRGAVQVVPNSKRYINDYDPLTGKKIQKLERGVPLTALENKIREDWKERVGKIARFTNQKLDDVVCVQKAELRSCGIRDYVTRMEEKVIPKEWEKSRVKWFKVRGEKNYSVPEPPKEDDPLESIEEFFAA